MIVRTTSNDASNVFIIKRPFNTDTSNTDNLIEVTDDITKHNLSYSVGFAEQGDYHRLSLQISGLKEGRYYTLKVFDRPAGGGDLFCVYKDKIFVTDQTIDQVANDTYSINDSEYTENSTSNNDYIII